MNAANRTKADAHFLNERRKSNRPIHRAWVLKDEFEHLGIARFERDFVEAQKQAYAETAVEDKAIGERLQRGRRALFHRGIDQAGPCHSPLEDGLRHFYEFMRRQLDPHLP